MGCVNSYGSELWTTDGTLAGTYMVRDVIPGFAGSYPSMLTVFTPRPEIPAQIFFIVRSSSGFGPFGVGGYEVRRLGHPGVFCVVRVLWFSALLSQAWVFTVGCWSLYCPVSDLAHRWYDRRHDGSI